jgi:iron complex transport system substrate-binding protein
MKKLTALLLALLFVLSAAACAPASSSEAKAAISFTDMTNREVKLDKPAEKIVVLTAADCEILFALGAGGSVIGRGEYCDYPAEVSNIPAVQSGSETNIEQIIALEPDVVIMSKMAQTLEQIAAMEGAGIKVIISDAQSIDGIYADITMLGQVVGKNDEAKALIDGMKKTFDDLKAKVPAQGGKTVYFEVSPLEYGLYAAGAGTFMDELAVMLGLENIFGDMEGWAHVSEEQILERNPDYIVTTAMSVAGAPDPVDEILGRHGWEGVTAVKSKAIYNADSNSSALMHPGPRLADAATELYNFVYGDSDAAPAPTK